MSSLDLRFIGDLALWQGLLLALAVGGLAWWLYWRETKALSNSLSWLLPTLRSAAIILAILILTAPVLHRRYREGEPGRLRFLIDSSRSMSIADRHMDASTKVEIARSLRWLGSDDNQAAQQTAVESFDSSSRYARGLERLLGTDDGVLQQLREEFEIVVERFDSERTRLWESTIAQTSPLPENGRAWIPEKFAARTQLGSALAAGSLAANTTAAPTSDDSATDPPAADEAIDLSGSAETIVLLSDGRNTAGVSPLLVAETLATQRRPIYAIGMGATAMPADISLVAIEHPERVFEKDLLRGTLVVRQRMPQAAPLKFTIKLAGTDEVVWEETRTQASDERGRIDFSLPVKPIIEKIQKQAGRGTNFSAVPVHLEASVAPQDGEADDSNNRRLFHVSVITKRSRLLLVDGRSRWETRYLHNMFERDPAWQVDLVLPDYRQSPPQLTRGTAANQFPSTKERLFEYDLIILGELPPNVMPRESIDWIKAFVESSGGGLIVVDGARGWLRDAFYKPIQSMLPIEWVEDKRVKPDPVPVRLTSFARQLPVFQLTPSDPGKNDAAWAQLPPLHLTTAVRALPGSEVLTTYTQDGDDIPLMATRQFGAGRVFYSGTDETWRWRFKVADTYHQRFWNQVGRWVMRLPMSVQGQFVSIDSGKLVYQPGETIAIRTRLRTDQGEPARQQTVEAVITEVGDLQSDSAAGNPEASPSSGSGETSGRASGQPESASAGRVIAVVPLTEETAIAGLYSGQIKAPAAGNYHVTIVAPGLTSAALGVHSEFSVTEPDSGEMDQLNCDEAVLRKLAEITRGQYLSEQEGGKLVDLLRPLSRGRIVESDTLLWQSYWWFVPIVLLLSIEWWLRKRVGLI